MHTPIPETAHRGHARMALILALLLTPASAFAAASAASSTESRAQIFLRPHCELQKQEECPGFPVENPLTLRTAQKKIGEALDIDIVIRNPGKQPITRVRSWLTYDPQILEGKTITANTSFTIPTPGETDFAPQDGYVKLELRTDPADAPADTVIPVARVQMTVKSAPKAGKTYIGFYDPQEDGKGHTAVITTRAGADQNLLPPKLGQLLVLLEIGEDGKTASAESAPKTPEKKTPAPAGERSAFVLLQVQDVRLTTQGSSIFVAWNPLSAPDLTAYNVYFGTESGRYIQRKSLSADSTRVTLRGLPTNTTYYVAVRGTNDRNEETAFSEEVAVKVGDANTATAPLSLEGDKETPKRNPVVRTGQTSAATVPGETGLPSTLSILLLTSAAIGTLYACRRQAIASTVRL